MLQRVLGFLIVILVLPDIYIYRTFIKQLTLSLFWRILYFFPTLFLMAGGVSLAFFANYEYAEQHTLWIGRFAVVFFLFASPKLIFTICSIIGRPFNRWLHWSRKPFVATGLVLATLNAALILYGSMVGKDRFEVKEVTFRSPRLPEAFNGYRIVQLSDIHIGSWQGNAKSLQRMVDLVNAQKPDLIVFTGDLVNNRAAELDGFEEILSQLHATDGVYSILGNHDYGPYYRWKSKRDQVNNLNDLKKRQADMGWTT